MKEYKRKITEEIYENAMSNHNGVLGKEDYDKVFTEAEVWGYGVYCPRVYKDNTQFFVHFELGDTCD